MIDFSRIYPDPAPPVQRPLLPAKPSLVQLKDREIISIATEAKRTVRAITGFPDSERLWDEYMACGGPQLFDGLDLHQRRYVADDLHEAGRRLVLSCKYPREQIEAAVKEVLKQHVERERTRRLHTRLPRENIFAVVWAVVGGGLRLDVIAALPYFHLSTTQLSLLIHNALPLVAKAWQERWCPPVPLTLEWLRANCTDAQGTLRLVMLADGTDVDMERSANRRTARFMYGTKKKTLKHHAVRQIVWSNSRGEILRVSPIAAASFSEVALLERDGFLDNINQLARASQSVVEVCLVLDRGYYSLREHIREQKGRYSSLRLTLEMPAHLISPGRRPKGALKVLKRKFFTNAEVLNNRKTASRRACNEIANLRLKWCRIFQRRIPLSLMASMGHYQTLAVGLARLRAGVKPNKK
jgi:hypothetical protein